MATELGTIHLPNRELPTCRQNDGSFKKSFANLEAAESYAKSIFEKYQGEELQRAYQCTLNPEHFHLTTQVYVPLEERTSSPYARAVLPLAPETEAEAEGRFRSTSAVIEQRRERIRALVSANPDRTYAEMAASLEIEPGTFNSDVNYLIKRGLLPSRSVGRSSAISKTPISAAARLAQMDLEIQNMLAAKAQVEREVEAEEAARIEREKVHVGWANGNTGTELSVRKNGQLIIFPTEAWREIIAAVAAEIQVQVK